MTTNKQYLGDGVYAEYDGFYFILTTENGIERLNAIYMEPDVWDSLLAYVRKTSEEQNAAK